MSDQVHDFWLAFIAATGTEGSYRAWQFGDDANALGLLVRDGAKRATTSLLSEYEADREPLPQPGDLSIVLDADDRPLCVIRTTRVDVARFGDVDAEFAEAEGEGDLSLRYWRSTHERFFASLGTRADDDTLVVLERFELLWPR